MDWYTFGLLLYEQLPLYLLCLAIALLLYFFIFRKAYLSFLDPYIFNLLYSVFGFSVVIFLALTLNMDARYLWSYLLTQGAFFAGIFTFSNLKKSDVIASDSSYRFLDEEGIWMKCLLMVSAGTYIIVQLFSYKLVGIPLTMESRTGAYANSGGFGILGRILDVLRPIIMFGLIYFFFRGRGTVLFNLVLIFITAFMLISIALSGSKSQLMTFGFIVFIYLILNGQRLKAHFVKLRKFEWYIVLAGLTMMFFTIVAQSASTTNNSGAINVFLFRLVASGDTYYFAYPNNQIEAIEGSKWFLALFGDGLSTIRIVPRQAQPGVLGVQLFQRFTDSDLVTGPNARHNVFGYVYYGFYGSILFSYLIGFVLSFTRNRLFFKLRKNLFGQLAFLILYLNISYIETDPPVAIWGLENAAIILPFILIATFILYVPFAQLKAENALPDKLPGYLNKPL